MKDEDEIPEELDDHLRIFGKKASEVGYGEECALCGTRIDEYGFCSCGSNAG